MPTSLLADLVLVGHLGIIVFAVFGALWAFRWNWAPLVHLPVLAWAAYIEISAGVCPLTPLENSLRQAAGESGYSSAFIEHYLVPLVYPPGLTSGAQLWLAASLLLLNGLFYAYLVARRRAQKKGVRPLNLHRTRHTWATFAPAAGKIVRWVADQLGHADRH